MSQYKKNKTYGQKEQKRTKLTDKKNKKEQNLRTKRTKKNKINNRKSTKEQKRTKIITYNYYNITTPKSKTMQKAGIRWTSKTEYYDIENGLQITKHKAETEYIKIKTNKNAKINELQTEGHISYTIECRRNPQLSIFADRTKRNS